MRRCARPSRGNAVISNAERKKQERRAAEVFLIHSQLSVFLLLLLLQLVMHLPQPETSRSISVSVSSSNPLFHWLVIILYTDEVHKRTRKMTCCSKSHNKLR